MTRPTSRNRERNVTLLPEIIIEVMLTFLSGLLESRQMTYLRSSTDLIGPCLSAVCKAYMSTVADETGLLPFSAHIRHRIQYVSFVTEKIPPNSHYFADKRHGFRAEPVEHDSRKVCCEGAATSLVLFFHGQ